MKTFICAVFTVLFFLGSALADANGKASAAGASKAVMVMGSDLIAPQIEAKLKELAKKQNIDIKCDFSGSNDAAKAISDGSADIAILAVPPGMNTPESTIKMPIAFHAALVIVNTINPLEEISTAQLKGIYSKNADPRIELWRQLNVKNIGLRNVMPLITSLSDNVIVELFKYCAMDSTNIGPWVNIIDKKQDIFNMIKANNSAIAIVGKLRDKNMIKILAVSKSKDGKNSYAFRPDINSFLNADYPLTLPFYIVLKKEKLEKVKEVAQILLGDDIAELIDASDFYSAPKNSREKSIFDLDINK